MKKDLHIDLKTGFTTGICAAAVAKAAVYMLVNEEILHNISVSLPSGDEIILDIENHLIHREYASCMIRKYSGDDPDITNGIKIFARASFNGSNDIQILAGEGIGRVTKPGLSVEIGEAAINPVPLQMIKNAIKQVLPENKGVSIELSIPEGVAIAKKTFNPILGIVDGISILGTTGIVKPMSEEALKHSLELRLKQLSEEGLEYLVFVPGNYATSFLKAQFTVDEKLIVQTSNFIGFMLEKAVRYGFKRILLVGHIGKLVKLAGGNFYTHSRIADSRNEILSAHYLKYSSNMSIAQQLMKINTTEEAVDILGKDLFWDYLATVIQQKAQRYVYDELEIGVITFSQLKGLLGVSKNVEALINDMHLQKTSYSQQIDTIIKETTISVCGIGPGNPKYIVPAVFEALASADLIIGAKRHLKLVKQNQIEHIEFTGNMQHLQEVIAANQRKKIVILVSGDTGFHSLRAFVIKAFSEIVCTCIPGISSFQYMYSKLLMSYENAYLSSLHGMQSDYMEALNKYESVFILTDKSNTFKKIANDLINCGLGDTYMYVGNRLSYDDELIMGASAKEMIMKNIECNLSVVVLIAHAQKQEKV